MPAFPWLAALLTLALCALPLPAWADRFKVLENPTYSEECASCHLAYPPQLLDADSWRAVMSGLGKHFGSDATVDDKRRQLLSDFLVSNASRRASRDAAGKPLLRISETAHFRHEHDELSAAVWQRPAIKSRANCGACHSQAATGDYRERHIRIPK